MILDTVLRVNASDTLLGKRRPVNFLWHFGIFNKRIVLSFFPLLDCLLLLKVK